MAFDTDDLRRQPFADLLISLSSALAVADVLPSGRVIAVDAPWGSGKSWIARQLPLHFNVHKDIGKCVYVDAFEFDFHQDPFAVVTSSIIDAYKTDTATLRNFKTTAADVMRASIPAIGKGVVKAGGKLIGVDTDELYESIFEVGSEASEKAIEKMLDTFSLTKVTTSKFKEKLSKLIESNADNKPLVVVIDELDRCRPSFALEMLERVKHLFDVKNVVFIFFIHAPALHSAIRKTYGNEINSTEYLRKFFALTIGLPNAFKPNPNDTDKENFTRSFLNSRYPLINVNSTDEDNFRNALAILSSKFNVTFRDIENIMLLWSICKSKFTDLYIFPAYFLLVKVIEPRQYIELKNKTTNAFEFEITRLGMLSDDEHHFISTIRDVFLFATDHLIYTNQSSPNYKKLSNKTSEQFSSINFNRAHKILVDLELEYLKL